MVANYSGEKRRFDSFATEAAAMEAASKLARQLSQRDVIGASMTRDQSVEYASAIQSLQPLGISLTAAVAVIVEAVKLTGDLPGVVAAARLYKARHKTVTPMKVADVVAELIKLKTSRGAAPRYLDDLNFRLDKFAAAFPCPIGSVTTAEVQAWLDGLKLSSQSYANNRRVAHLLFEFATARGFALDNQVAGIERVKVHNGAVEIFTPEEAAKLLAAAPKDFRPCLALGLFAGLRSAEIERLSWQDLDLKAGHIIVGAKTAKTRSRRIVPICDALAAWLTSYAGQQGSLWPHGRICFHKRQEASAKAAGVPWKRNAARHSFASYRLAQTQNAAQVALECGNSPQVIFKHYRELVQPADAQRWFAVKPS